MKLLLKFIVKAGILVVLVYSCVWGIQTVTRDASHQNVALTLPLPQIVTVPNWERKLPLDDTVFKIGLITDTHVDTKRNIQPDGSDDRFLPEEDKRHIAQFATQMADFSPSFIVHLGDVIDGKRLDISIGTMEAALVRDAMRVIGVPLYWAIGNHDLRSMTRRTFLKALEIDYVNTYFDDGPYRFVILDTNYRSEGIPNHPLSGDFVPGYLPEITRNWLVDALDTQKHVYVFMHHSLIPAELTDKNPMTESMEIMKMFSDYNVTAVFNGHIEKRFHGEFDGVAYYSLPGTKKHAVYPGAFYELTLNENGPSMRMYYEEANGGKIFTEPFITPGKMIGDILKVQTQKDSMEAQSDKGA